MHWLVGPQQCVLEAVPRPWLWSELAGRGTHWARWHWQAEPRHRTARHLHQRHCQHQHRSRHPPMVIQLPRQRPRHRFAVTQPRSYLAQRQLQQPHCPPHPSLRVLPSPPHRPRLSRLSPLARAPFLPVHPPRCSRLPASYREWRAGAHSTRHGQALQEEVALTGAWQRPQRHSPSPQHRPLRQHRPAQPVPLEESSALRWPQR